MSHHRAHKLRSGESHRIQISHGLLHNLLPCFAASQCYFCTRGERVAICIVHDYEVVEYDVPLPMLTVSCRCQVLVVSLLAVKCRVIRERCLVHLFRSEP